MRKPNRKINNESQKRKLRRKLSIRRNISGSAERPRLCAIRSNKHLQIQVVDDDANKTIFAMQTFGKNAVGSKNNKDSATELGKAVAKELQNRKIENAVFDRNGGIYTGVIATLANAIRENGIRI